MEARGDPKLCGLSLALNMVISGPGHLTYVISSRIGLECPVPLEPLRPKPEFCE